MQITTRPLTRKQLSDFLPNPRSIIAFENLQGDVSNTGDVLSTAPFITTQADGNLGEERVLTGSANVSVTDGGAGADVTLDLEDTTVVPATYGAATKLVVLAIDAKGRVTSASEITLNSDNVAEGVTNLYFTQARARASVSGSAGITYNSGTGGFTLDQSFTRGLLSGAGQVSYNAGTGAINTTGKSGTAAYTNFTFVNGICTAAS